jgi:hypothetical protein
VAEIQALEADRGQTLGYVRLVGRHRAEAQLSDPAVSVPPHYQKKQLLRGPAQSAGQGDGQPRREQGGVMTGQGRDPIRSSYLCWPLTVV